MKDNLGYWLCPFEQERIIKILIDQGLIKWDPEGQLPLKSGGLTDIYINLREGRSHPLSIPIIAKYFANAIGRLNPNRFVEVPSAVTCFSADISRFLNNMPFFTIRGEEKEGRVTDAKIIGSCESGDKVVIYDDVITDGGSKIVPLKICISCGINILGVVVLVDRQQGWRKKFADSGISIPVWAGMTLHDIRKYLVCEGILPSPDPYYVKRNRIILALDKKNTFEDYLNLLIRVRSKGLILKVNDLFLDRQAAGVLIEDLSVYGRVMVDLKFHDMPDTVVAFARRLANLKTKPWAITVHASGGAKMVQSAVKSLSSTETKVLAVTLLTSLDEEKCHRIYCRDDLSQVIEMAHLAASAGAHGFICSAREVRTIKSIFPNHLVVVPGTRSPGTNTHDQVRLDTPRNAVLNGADYLVIGREVTGADDPVAEINRIEKDIY